MRHRDEIILRKIINEIDIAHEMLGGADFAAFDASEMQKRSICMTVINIGELVKGLSEEMRAAHGDIPWRMIAGFRDIAAHKYQTLVMNDVYNTVTDDFPALRDAVMKILQDKA